MKRFVLPALLAAIFLLGLGVRLYDLTDPPFDFHPTRQWRSALIARGMYYAASPDAPEPERTTAIAQWHQEALIEPEIMEWLTARLYLLAGGEYLWFARILSAVFWVLGGLAVYLAGRSIANTAAGLVALAYFLFLPFGMLASRSFQPDPLMVALMAGAVLALQRWADEPGWNRAVWAGLLTGLAIFVKLVAIFPLGLAALALVIAERGLRAALRDRQVWTIGGLALFPFLAYYVNGLFFSGFLDGQGSLRVVNQLWTDPAFYIRWVEMATGICGLTALLAGLAGIFLARQRSTRAILAGLWAGFLVYGMLFPFHIITHDYYTLPLVPIAAVSLAPTIGLLFDELDRRSYAPAARLSLCALVAGVILFKVWDTRVILVRQDYRDHVAEWSRFHDLIPPDQKVIAITQAYGYPLAYYGWVSVRPWLNESDAELRSLSGQTADEIDARRDERLAGMDLFLITNFNEYDDQPDLKQFLETSFPIFAEGDGYLIYDLSP